MNFVLWIILGGLAGWLASIITKSPMGILMDVLLGIVGAVVGGFLMSLIGQPGVTGFNVYSVLVSAVGAILLIWIGRVLSGGAYS